MPRRDETRCPQCKGTLKPKYLGEFSDKHVECEFCGHVEDVPDASTVTHEEEESFVDERGNRVRRTRRVTHRRRDGSSSTDPRPVSSGFEGLASPMTFRRPDGYEVWVDLEDPTAARETLSRELAFPMTEADFEQILAKVRSRTGGVVIPSGWRDLPATATFEAVLPDGSGAPIFEAELIGGETDGSIELSWTMEEVRDVTGSFEPAAVEVPSRPLRHRSVHGMRESIREQARRSQRVRERVRASGRGKLALGIALGVALTLAALKLL